MSGGLFQGEIQHVCLAGYHAEIVGLADEGVAQLGERVAGGTDIHCAGEQTGKVIAARVAQPAALERGGSVVAPDVDHRHGIAQVVHDRPVNEHGGFGELEIDGCHAAAGGVDIQLAFRADVISIRTGRAIELNRPLVRHRRQRVIAGEVGEGDGKLAA